MVKLAVGNTVLVERPRALTLVERPAPRHDPLPSRGFVGRGPELEQIAGLLRGRARLITLTGSGGVGKTRLATEAADLQGSHRGVVYWVRLAGLPTDAGATVVAAEVARSVLGGDGCSGEAVVEVLSEAARTLADRRVLLVVDGCEHVIEGVGQVIADLLDTVPELTVVATSREPIGWRDEQLLTVPPLTPQESIELFCERAEFAGCPVAEPDELAMAEQICRRVHYHPLFIRLAAARLMRQPIAVVLRELSCTDSDRRMTWSHGPRVGADARHQRVRDVIGWSYDLCETKERSLLDHMSVFPAELDTNPAEERGEHPGSRGVDVDAIQAICADAGDQHRPAVLRLARDEIESLLERLADRSLVSRRITETGVRYYLVESVRLFVRGRMRAEVGGSEKLALLAQRHRRYYRDIVLRARAQWGGAAERTTLHDLRPSWSNIMAALEADKAEPDEQAVAFQIVAALFPLPLVFLGDSMEELRVRVQRLLAEGGTRWSDRHGLVAQAMAAWLALCQGRQPLAAELLSDCFTTCAVAGSDWRSNPETDIGLPAPAEFVWGVDLMFTGRDARAAMVFARASDKYRRDGDRAGVIASDLMGRLTTGVLGPVEDGMGADESGSEEVGLRQVAAVADLVAATVLTRRRESARALMLERRALQRLLESGDRWGALWAVQARIWSLSQTVGGATRSTGDSKSEVVDMAIEAARLVGGATALRARLGIDIAGLGPFSDQHKEAVETLFGYLGHDAYTTAEQQGARLCLEKDELQRFALGALSIESLPPEHPARRHVPTHWDELTLAEEEVALLAAAGWTNTAIASRRGSSFKTVNAQMASVFKKLSITSRDGIAGLVPRSKLDRVRSETVARPRRARAPKAG